MADNYLRRPGASPAIAALLAAGVIQSEHRVLEICCGEGEDSLLLACGGVSNVLGIDRDGSSIRVARASAKKHRLQTGPRGVRFRRQDLRKALATEAPASINVVIDTLGSANVEGTGRSLSAAVARIVKDNGLWITHARVADHPDRRPYQLAGGMRMFPSGTDTHFFIGVAYPTHLAEYAPAPDDEEEEEVRLAPVYFAIARRKPRRSRARR